MSDGNPLEDIRHTNAIAGIMVRRPLAPARRDHPPAGGAQRYCGDVCAVIVPMTSAWSTQVRMATTRTRACRARSAKPLGVPRLGGRLQVVLLFGTLLAGIRPMMLAAQARGVDAAARAGAISDTSVARWLDVLVSDSLRDRTTPSAALDRTARYLADQMRGLGLQPGANDLFPSFAGYVAPPERRAWTMRYPIPGQHPFDTLGAHLSIWTTHPLRGGRRVLSDDGEVVGRSDLLRFGYAARLLAAAPAARDHARPIGAVPPIYTLGERVVLVAGPVGQRELDSLTDALDSKPVVLYVPPVSGDSAASRRVLSTLYAVSAGVVVVPTAASPGPSLSAAPLQMIEHYLTHGRPWPSAVEVRPDLMAGILASAGVDLAALHAARRPVVRALNGVTIAWTLGVRAPGTDSQVTAPLVAGLIPGTDSLLAHEYVVLMTPMDIPVPADTTLPANSSSHADSPRATGVNVAGLLALGRALTDPAVRLRRSVLLVATSGASELGAAWGSRALLWADGRFSRSPGRTIVVSFDAGGGRSDSVIVEGGDLLVLSPSPAWLATAHPELGLTVVERSLSAASESNVVTFARDFRVPTLALHRSSSRGIEAEPAAGAVGMFRYLFWLGYELANAERLPQWSETSRAMLSELREHDFRRLRGRYP